MKPILSAVAVGLCALLATSCSGTTSQPPAQEQASAMKVEPLAFTQRTLANGQWVFVRECAVGDQARGGVVKDSRVDLGSAA